MSDVSEVLGSTGGLGGGGMGEKGKEPSNSMVPLLSVSTSLTMSWTSASVGLRPRESMTFLSSEAVMSPV